MGARRMQPVLRDETADVVAQVRLRDFEQTDRSTTAGAESSSCAMGFGTQEAASTAAKVAQLCAWAVCKTGESTQEIQKKWAKIGRALWTGARWTSWDTVATSDGGSAWMGCMVTAGRRWVLWTSSQMCLVLHLLPVLCALYPPLLCQSV